MKTNASKKSESSLENEAQDLNPPASHQVEEPFKPIPLKQWAEWFCELHDTGNLTESVAYSIISLWGSYSAEERKLFLDDPVIKRTVTLLEVDSVEPELQAYENCVSIIDEITSILNFSKMSHLNHLFPKEKWCRFLDLRSGLHLTLHRIRTLRNH